MSMSQNSRLELGSSKMSRTKVRPKNSGSGLVGPSRLFFFLFYLFTFWLLSAILKTVALKGNVLLPTGFFFSF